MLYNFSHHRARLRGRSFSLPPQDSLEGGSAWRMIRLAGKIKSSQLIGLDTISLRFV